MNARAGLLLALVAVAAAAVAWLVMIEAIQRTI